MFHLAAKQLDLHRSNHIRSATEQTQPILHFLVPNCTGNFLIRTQPSAKSILFTT